MEGWERVSECGRGREDTEKEEKATRKKRRTNQGGRKGGRGQNITGDLPIDIVYTDAEDCFRRSADRRALTGEKTTICTTFVFGKYSNARRNASYLMKKTKEHNICRTTQ